jgi:hypothetical protein
MTNAFTKAQFMAPPSTGAVGPVPIGAVKAGTGVAISADGTISLTGGGGTVSDIVATNGIQGGGQGPQVFLGLLPPSSTTIGGVRTISGSGVSIDSSGVIRAINNVTIASGTGIAVTDFGGGSFSVALRIAGSASNQLGGVYVPTTQTSGLSLGADGELKLSAPFAGGIGGVKAGSGCTIAPDGTLNATGTGGTISGVLPGVGLVGGGTSGTVTLSLVPAAAGQLGGIKVGTGLTVAPDGTLNANGGTLQTVTDAGAITNKLLTFNSDPIGTVLTTLGYQGLTGIANGNPTIGFETASGRLRIYSQTSPGTLVLSMGAGGIDGTISTTASGQRLLLTGTTGVGLFLGLDEKLTISPTGVVIANQLTAAGFTYPTTDGAAGTVLTTNGSKVLSFSSVLPLTGGTMSGNIVFAGTQTFPPPVGFLPLTGGVITGTLGVEGATFINSNTAGEFGLPATAGAAGEQLTSNGDGTTSWAPASAGSLPLTGGTMTGDIVFSGTQTFQNTLSTAGGTMTGDIVFAGTQTFPAPTGVLNLSGGTMTGDIVFAATQDFPIATTSALGVVQPDGTTITITAGGVISAVGGSGTVTSVTGTAPVQVATGTTTPVISVSAASTTATGIVQLFDGVGSTSTTTAATPNSVRQAYDLAALQLPLSGGTMTGNITFTGTQTFPGVLPLAGGTMTGNITFNAGQAFPGTIPATLLDVTGDIVYASAANTPASLPIGATGNILGVVGGLPAWRTPAAAGLLTTTVAASTYAPINSPTLTGPVIVNAGGGAGSNAFTISGGSIVLSTSFTPSTSGDTGSTGEISWDANYLYVCTAPNTWGRIAIDSTPF